MTRNEVLKLALESGFAISTAYGQKDGKLMPISDTKTLESFARAVAEREREECAKVCEAHIEDRVETRIDRVSFRPMDYMLKKCAAVIRARGEQ